MPTRETPDPTPEQIEKIMTRLIGAARNVTEQRAIFRIGVRVGLLWTHRGCTSKGGVNFTTNQRCTHCGAPRPNNAAGGVR